MQLGNLKQSFLTAPRTQKISVLRESNLCFWVLLGSLKDVKDPWEVKFIKSLLTSLILTTMLKQSKATDVWREAKIKYWFPGEIMPYFPFYSWGEQNFCRYLQQKIKYWSGFLKKIKHSYFIYNTSYFNKENYCALINFIGTDLSLCLALSGKYLL